MDAYRAPLRRVCLADKQQSCLNLQHRCVQSRVNTPYSALRIVFQFLAATVFLQVDLEAYFRSKYGVVYNELPTDNQTPRRI